MVAVPAGLPVGIVEGRFLFVSQDQADADHNADYTVVTGLVKFTCSSKVPLQVASQDLVLVPLTFYGEFDSAGYLIPVGDDTDTRGIELPASSSGVYNPSGFTWKVTFDIRDANGNAVKIPPFNMFVQEGVVNEMADQLPLGESGGVIITRGEQGYSIDGVTVDDRTLYFSLNDLANTILPGVDIGPAIDDAVIARVFPSGIALDTDGVPYILPGANDVHVLFDTDGVPYFV